ncbi:MAG: zf-HC2 domain-containing protein [Gammaproteobacteria bacterium]|nr:zf-HC2 domain-containing protein [Gammaproteobacteria bacterium]
MSLSMDRTLALRERLALGLHLCTCSMCRAYRRQVVILRDMARALAARMRQFAPGEMDLSPTAAARMRRALERENSGNDP